MNLLYTPSPPIWLVKWLSAIPTNALKSNCGVGGKMYETKKAQNQLCWLTTHED